ncbi:unnamed protein product, partial [Mesorhabditis spiculigera]
MLFSIPLLLLPILAANAHNGVELTGSPEVVIKEATAYPFIVAITQQNESQPWQQDYKCDGSIVDKDWVVVPATCVPDSVDISTLVVTAGTSEIRTTSELKQVRAVVKKRTHVVAFALLRLKEPIDFGNSAQPVVVPKNSEKLKNPSTRMKLLGRSQGGNELLYMTEFTQQAALDSCDKAAYGHIYYQPCGVPTNFSGRTCPGGGPLMFPLLDGRNQIVWVQIGMIGSRVQCDVAKGASLLNLTDACEWMEQIVEHPVCRDVVLVSSYGVNAEIPAEQLVNDIKDYPYMVAIMEKKEGEPWQQIHNCSGTIIDKNWVLTSLECVAKVDLTKLVVIAGVAELRTASLLKQTREVTEKRSPPKIPSIGGWSTRTPEIALLRLKEPLSFGDSVQPVFLAKDAHKFEQDKKRLTALGWGQPGSDPKERLRAIFVNGESGCESLTELSPGYFCAVPTSFPGICQGDVGGPLMHPWEAIDIRAHHLKLSFWLDDSLTDLEVHKPTGKYRRELPKPAPPCDVLLAWLNNNTHEFYAFCWEIPLEFLRLKIPKMREPMQVKVLAGATEIKTKSSVRQEVNVDHFVFHKQYSHVPISPEQPFRKADIALLRGPLSPPYRIPLDAIVVDESTEDLLLCVHRVNGDGTVGRLAAYSKWKSDEAVNIGETKLKKGLYVIIAHSLGLVGVVGKKRRAALVVHCERQFTARLIPCAPLMYTDSLIELVARKGRQYACNVRAKTEEGEEKSQGFLFQLEHDKFAGTMVMLENLDPDCHLQFMVDPGEEPKKWAEMATEDEDNELLWFFDNTASEAQWIKYRTKVTALATDLENIDKLLETYGEYLTAFGMDREIRERREVGSELGLSGNDLFFRAAALTYCDKFSDVQASPNGPRLAHYAAVNGAIMPSAVFQKTYKCSLGLSMFQYNVDDTCSPFH